MFLSKNAFDLDEPSTQQSSTSSPQGSRSAAAIPPTVSGVTTPKNGASTPKADRKPSINTATGETRETELDSPMSPAARRAKLLQQKALLEKKKKERCASPTGERTEFYSVV